MHGTYEGPIRHLQGKTAMLRQGESNKFLAQFDDLSLGREYTHNWVSTPAGHWKLDPATDLE